MSKKVSGIVSGGLDAMLAANAAAEQAPVTTLHFNEFRKQVDYVFNIQQQQLISFDVALGLLMEHVIPEDKRKAFKDEVARRVKALAEDMVKKQKDAEKMVVLG
jgi:4-alpha-glucanotransferase